MEARPLISPEETKYNRFARRRIEMWGGDTDALMKAGRISTPHTTQFTQRNFPLQEHDYSELLVFAKHEGEKTIEEWLEELDLDQPTPEHAIRFVSQYDRQSRFEPHTDQKIIFPHVPRLDHGVVPASLCVTASIWHPASGAPQLCLYHARKSWATEFTFVGVARRNRLRMNLPTSPRRFSATA